MRNPRNAVLSGLGLGLLASLNVLAETPYYNPSNPASSTGKTTGYDLYKTIGCPGRGLLEAPCAGSVEAKVAVPVAAPVVKAAPIDSDDDGVPDAIDQCPNTPAGAKVDARGCELDSDGDGIVDRLDQCPNTPAGVRVDATGCPLPKTLKLEGVRFDNDSDVLRHESDVILDEATATLKRYPEFKVEVAGYTDSRGGSAHNLDLSSRRAKAVMDYFIAHGIAADRLSAKGYGEANPVANNYLEEGRMKNRRVDLRPLN